MTLNTMFKKSRNELEKGGRSLQVIETAKKELADKCPSCGATPELDELVKNQYVCGCGYCYRMNARQRISFLTDRNSFTELFEEMKSKDLLSFPGYAGKLELSKKATGENEAVICGTAAIVKHPCALFVMEPNFMMGSMGTIVGEKITKLFEYALEHRLPVVGCTVSGGARMQEGILSLMQMAKTSGAVKRHSDAGLLYITILTDPTTGGVTASFAMEGDIILAEPGATVGFAGARVIEQTVRKKLPAGFQKAEFILDHGFADKIVPRNKQKRVVAHLLAMHGGSYEDSL